jgi:hypothetical protein
MGTKLDIKNKWDKISRDEIKNKNKSRKWLKNKKKQQSEEREPKSIQIQTSMTRFVFWRVDIKFEARRERKNPLEPNCCSTVHKCLVNEKRTTWCFQCCIVRRHLTIKKCRTCHLENAYASHSLKYV